MNITYTLNEIRTIALPVDAFVHSQAGNSTNPFDHIGVLHNALVSVALSQLANDHYRGIKPTGDSIFAAVTGRVQKAALWDIHCICVTQDGCPCTDFLDWIRSTFPLPNNAPIPFPRDSFPDKRLGASKVEQLALSKLPDKDARSFTGFYRRLHAALDDVRSGKTDIQHFQRGIVALERRIMVETLEPETRQALLAGTSVARHSMFMALASGRGVSEAPEWVGDDADGATLGGITGSPGGVGGAAIGAAVGASIFSLATATGWW